MSCSSLQDPGKTSVAITGYPFFNRFLAMGVPMFPRPTNPTGVFEAIDRDDTEGGQKDSISVIKKNMRHSVLLSRAIQTHYKQFGHNLYNQ